MRSGTKINKVAGQRKDKRVPVIAPSEFICCASGTCPQHQQQGEADLSTQVNCFMIKHTQDKNRPLWAEAS